MVPARNPDELDPTASASWARRYRVRRQGPAEPRTIEALVNDFLVANDPYPAGTAVFAARWKPSQWGLAQVISRTDLDEWTVVFLDGSGKVLRDHVELCPAL
jgi:hypothetical protein